MSELVTLLTGAGGAFLVKFIGPAAESLGKAFWERIQTACTKAKDYLDGAEHDMQPVEPKLIKPILEGAALESNAELFDRWAALLANAADSTQQVKVQVGFVDILRQLTVTDALIIDNISYITNQYSFDTRTHILSDISMLKRICASTATEQDLNVAFDNVVRLGLCWAKEAVPPQDLVDLIGGGNRGSGPASNRGSGKDKIAITHLGLAFLAAVTPPAKASTQK